MFSVEFIGIPGSGKSTLRSELLKSLKIDSRQKCIDTEEAFIYVARSRLNRLYRVLLKPFPRNLEIRFIKKMMNHSPMEIESQNEFLARYGEALNAFLASPGFRQMVFDDRKIVVGAFLAVGALYQASSEQIGDDTAVFFDEGLIQKSMMFVSHNNDHRNDNYVFDYLNHIPLPNLIVYVKADVALCVERMKLRSKGLTKRLAKADGDGAKRFLTNADDHMEKAVALLKKGGMSTVLEVNNNTSVGETLKMLTSLLPQYMRNLCP